MLPDDKILVAIMNNRRDMAIAREQGWYRIPVKHAPRFLDDVQWLAFYQTRVFDDEKWSINYYARLRGHELVTRLDLLPQEADHPRANERYYKLQLGPLQKRPTPIVSRRWRRITFFYTTGDRFQAAEEINDLFISGRAAEGLYVTLKEAGLAPERHYMVREGGVTYRAELVVPCRRGLVTVVVGDQPAPRDSLRFSEADLSADPLACIRRIRAVVDQHGGPLSPDSRLTG
jgi:hypothetical protein